MNRREQAFAEGKTACKEKTKSPYVSGQQVFSDWINGFVSAIETKEDLPDENESFWDAYIAGRGIRKLGIPFEGDYTGPVFSGWLDQKALEKNK